jgi:predicted alpha/beta-fold hydrolase
MINPQWVSRLAGFRPAWWMPGGHAQTLSAAFWTGHNAPEKGVARPIALPDGDALVAMDDCPSQWKPGDPALLMMHGLGGSARNSLLVRVSLKLTERGVRVFRLNLRGCGTGAGLARLPYNAGRSGDLKAAVNAVIEWCRPATYSADQLTRQTPLTLFGMSLSANVLLKYLGEEGEQVPPSVVQAMAVNPPFDLARSVATLKRTLNKPYDRHFVGSLIDQIKAQIAMRPDFAPLPNPLPQTLYEFDNHFTAPHGGFPDAASYYQHSSALPRIPFIRVPTVILTAADDPMVPVDMFHEHRTSWPESVQLAITPGGGHLGYVGSGHGDPDSRWLDWRIVELVSSLSR